MRIALEICEIDNFSMLATWRLCFVCVVHSHFKLPINSIKDYESSVQDVSIYLGEFGDKSSLKLRITSVHYHHHY